MRLGFGRSLPRHLKVSVVDVSNLTFASGTCLGAARDAGEGDGLRTIGVLLASDGGGAAAAPPPAFGLTVGGMPPAGPPVGGIPPSGPPVGGIPPSGPPVGGMPSSRHVGGRSSAG